MGLVNFIHNGFSMSPVLEPDDIVIVETEFLQIERGDIVLFKDIECGDYVAHRVIAQSPFITKGDNSPFDEQTNPEQVIGIVIGRIREEKTQTWGLEGSSLKPLKATFSKYYQKKYPRFFRGFFKLLTRLI